MKSEEEIEQLAERYADGYSTEEAHASYIAFQDGYTKCQEDNKYSEEEVLDLLAGFIDSRGKDFVPFKDIQKWFEQFKKK